MVDDGPNINCSERGSQRKISRRLGSRSTDTSYLVGRGPKLVPLLSFATIRNNMAIVLTIFVVKSPVEVFIFLFYNLECPGQVP